ncbi:MAG: hypothetical protein IPL49_03705 [Saprospirales bacterium]|nr:hypothetical protein [Saprospirales bacterium]
MLFTFISCRSQPQHTTISLQPYGSFPEALLDTIQQTIGEVYSFQTEVLPNKSLPRSAFVNVKSPRYRADSLLRIIRKEMPRSADYVLGLTEKDISTTKRDANSEIKKPEYKYIDWGICGLGYCPGPCCVVSTFRLQTPDQKKFVERLKKICIHEIGHNLGLEHCTHSAGCVMRDAAETVKTIDLVELKLCTRCRARLNFLN